MLQPIVENTFEHGPHYGCKINCKNSKTEVKLVLALTYLHNMNPHRTNYSGCPTGILSAYILLIFNHTSLGGLSDTGDLPSIGISPNLAATNASITFSVSV